MWSRTTSALLLLVALALCGPLTGSANAAWTRVTGQSALSTTSLYGLSCPTASHCVAVGRDANGAAVRVGNGGTWSSQSVGQPNGTLSGVACLSANDCVAVGNFTSGGGGFTTFNSLIETWDGTSWTQSSSPNHPGDDQNFLFSVACVPGAGGAPNECTAVGFHKNTGGSDHAAKTFVLEGTQPPGSVWSWTEVSSPDPGLTNNGLQGVACPDANTCIAVGYAQSFQSSGNFNGALTLKGTRSGGTWTWTQLSVDNAGGGLNAVSCPSTTSCVAVGGQTASGPLAETWNGDPSGFAQMADGPLVNAHTSELDAISCTTPSLCTAVGSQTRTQGGNSAPLIELLDSAGWREAPASSSGSGAAELRGVVCDAASSTCTAAGTDNGDGLVESGPAAAPPLAVTTTNDGDDAHPGDGVCATSSGACTLRAALEESNASPDGETVTVPAGDYPLNDSELVVSSYAALFGAGARTTTIDASGASRALRFSSGTSSVSGVTVTGGNGGSTANSGVGGGIWIDSGAALSLTDSAVTGNTASRSGGGIDVDGTLTLLRSAVTHNQVTGTSPGAGGGVDDFGTATIVDSTISGNSAVISGGVYNGAGLVLESSTVAGDQGGDGNEIFNDSSATAQNTLVANPSGGDCQGNAIGSGGHNLSSDATCGFTSSSNGDQQGVDPLLGSLQDNGGPTDTRALLEGSPAIDAGASCPAVDQRGVQRPQGTACDIGAFELVPGSAGGGSTGGGSGGSAGGGGASGGSGSGGGGSGGGGAGGAGNSGNGGGGTAKLPPPVLGRSVDVALVRGLVLVRVPGSHRFVVLHAGERIPLGTIVDATHGVVLLTSARDRNGHLQSADFYDGVFRVSQILRPKQITVLTLVGALPSCAPAGRARAARRHGPRSLWGDGHGSFRTRGRYSAATVRGTKWLTEDECAGTLTRVARGVVSVNDLVRHRTVFVHAGHSYLARPPRRR